MTEAFRPPQAQGIPGSSRLVLSPPPPAPPACDSPSPCLPARRRPRPAAQSLATCQGYVATPGPPHQTTATPGPALRRGAHAVARLGLRDTARLLPCPGASRVTATRAHAVAAGTSWPAGCLPHSGHMATSEAPTPSFGAPPKERPKALPTENPSSPASYTSRPKPLKPPLKPSYIPPNNPLKEDQPQSDPAPTAPAADRPLPPPLSSTRVRRLARAPTHRLPHPASPATTAAPHLYSTALPPTPLTIGLEGKAPPFRGGALPSKPIVAGTAARPFCGHAHASITSGLRLSGLLKFCWEGAGWYWLILRGEAAPCRGTAINECHMCCGVSFFFMILHQLS